MDSISITQHKDCCWKWDATWQLGAALWGLALLSTLLSQQTVSLSTADFEEAELRML